MSPLFCNAITTMWMIAALHVVIVVVLSTLFLIFRDAIAKPLS